MKASQHKAILVELDTFITKLEKIADENGKDDPVRPHLNLLIDKLCAAFVRFEVNDKDVEDD